ncbi:MAG: response regulator transcription factor [Sulfuricella sp.]|nr:response regulator transcription factor [Sulfuricella sp.]
MIRVLIADDHRILREGLKQLLAESGDIIVGGEAENGFEALDKARKEDWDAVVLDMSMPGKSGIDLIRQIKDEKPKLPILILSMHKEDMYALRTLKAGASGYLSKDSASAELVKAIRKVAGGGVYINSNIAEKLAIGLMPANDVAPHTLLSDREYQIFLMLVSGQGITEIADELNLSVKTVSTHKTRIMQKMNITSLSGLIKYAIKHGLLEDGEETPE